MKSILIPLLILATIGPGCLPKQMGSKESHQSFAPHSLAAEDYDQAVNQLLAENPPDGKNAEVHRRLSLLYSSALNPRQDYQKAATELELFRELTPEGPARFESEVWRGVVKDVLGTREKLLEVQQGLDRERLELQQTNKKNQREIDRLHQQSKELSGEITQLKATITELETERSKLTETINQLKYLDLNLEKKRKSFQ
ncbi:MAG: hypothetical protein KJ589_06440 [Proteobacteria bacterium]|nr:hypothetical protein [Pseudomonadota bacterium]